MCGQRNRKPIGEVLLGLLTQSLLGAELRAPPLVNRRAIEFRVFGDAIFFQFFPVAWRALLPRTGRTARY